MQRQTPSSGPVQTGGRPAITTHDRLWAEMQLKLEDIELSASASGTAATTGLALGHGSAALEDLRVAQVALAQAWRRNKEDSAEAPPEPHATTAGGAIPEEPEPDDDRQDPENNKATTAAAAATVAPEADDAAADAAKSFYLEDKTHADIQSARRRREANDEHFGKVSKGVLDVVQKLDTVAKSMIVVEEATKEIWAPRDSNNNNGGDGGTSLSEDSASLGATRR